MNETHEHTPFEQGESADQDVPFDYDFVNTTSRIALYDDLRSAPRVTEIPPSETTVYIERLASTIYEQAKMAGGTIPYTAIREVSENFIHARFTEVVVSILDGGNTIRFADQGPGIHSKEKVQKPGFTSAIEPMKKYIRGVGSGLPIVKEYLDLSHGTITIEDNLNSGAVVTISMGAPDAARGGFADPSATMPQSGFAAQQPLNQPGGFVSQQPIPYPSEFSPQRTAANPGASGIQPQPFAQPQATPLSASAVPATQQPFQSAVSQGYAEYRGTTEAHAAPIASTLSQRERDFLSVFLSEGALGVTDMVKYTEAPQSSTYNTFKKLEESGLIERTKGQKRILTELGFNVATSLR